MTCETCGGETWNNVEKVRGGWKGPLYKCKDKACGWVKWPPRKAATSAPSASQGPLRGPKWTWASLGKTYERSLLLAELRMRESAERLKLPLTMSDVQAGTATIFITATRDGVEEPAVKLPPKPMPRQDAEPEPEEEWAGEPGPY